MTTERKAVEALREEWAKLKEALLPVLVTSGLFRGAASVPSMKAFEAALSALDAAQGEAGPEIPTPPAGQLCVNPGHAHHSRADIGCQLIDVWPKAAFAQEAGPSREALMELYYASIQMNALETSSNLEEWANALTRCTRESEQRSEPPRADGQCEDCSENKWVTFEAKLTVCAECGCAVSWEKRPGPPVEAGPKRVHVAQEHDNAWCPGHAVATSECPAPVEAAPAGMEESR